ncbi:uncharacterized protein tow [Anabrus simplex]|uniref:uncharacterized protein tow n=1 Tax=Anabrus simplex TaxID=316456 RepID=UPI0034DCD524
MGCGQSKIGNIYPRKSKNKRSNKRSGVEADSEEDNDDADGATQTDDVDSASREKQPVSTGPLLVQTEMSTSQMDFFKMLDEKIESGPDYDSANEEEMALERARLCALLRDWDAASQGSRSPARNHYRQQNGELRYNSVVQYRGGTAYTELA